MSTDAKQPDYLDPLKGPLTDQEVRAAAGENILRYPQVIRGHTDPAIPGQKLANMSFMLFSEPKKLSSGSPVYGFIKIRGCYSDESSATAAAANLIRTYDSKFKIRQGPVGSWLPITEDRHFVRDYTDIREDDDPEQIQAQALREKEEHERRIAQEIREREDLLQNEKDIYEDQMSLDFYSMRRVTEMRLQERIDYIQKQLDAVRSKQTQVRRQLKGIERQHPEYMDQWIDRYNQERAQGGIPPFIPSKDLFVEYDNWVDEEKLETIAEEADSASSASNSSDSSQPDQVGVEDPMSASVLDHPSISTD